jgi:hypothetical protein
MIQNYPKSCLSHIVSPMLHMISMNWNEHVWYQTVQKQKPHG